MLTHERDLEYFGEYPAPIMQAVQELHHTNINSTISFFGPMLYFLLRDIGAEQVLEIGHAEGYTAHYLANAVKDNGTRFGMKDNKYYGIDIVQTEKVRSALEAKGLPVDVRNVDSMTLSPETFPGLLFDVIFQDGCHDTDHVLHEFKTMWFSGQARTG
jgi:predicted O-methyltransferase YrrM